MCALVLPCEHGCESEHSRSIVSVLSLCVSYARLLSHISRERSDEPKSNECTCMVLDSSGSEHSRSIVSALSLTLYCECVVAVRELCKVAVSQQRAQESVMNRSRMNAHGVGQQWE